MLNFQLNVPTLQEISMPKKNVRNVSKTYKKSSISVHETVSSDERYEP